MRPGQEFTDFPIENLGIMVARVAKQPAPNGRERILRVPLVVRRGDELLITDMKSAKARANRPPSNNACLTLPWVSINRTDIGPLSPSFRTLVFGAVVGRRGILNIIEEDRRSLKKSLRPFGVYKDYFLRRKGIDTTITIVPAATYVHREKEAPIVQHDFRKICGETTWVSIEDARQQLVEQAELMPDNNLAQDVAALIAIATTRVFKIQETAQI